MKRLCCLAILCWSTLVVYGCGIEFTSVPPKTAVEAPVPETPLAPSAGGPSEVSVRVVDYAGLSQAIAARRGQVVVLDAWATWCVPCVKNFPHLIEMHRKHAAQGLACMSLSFDALDSEQASLEKAVTDAREFLIAQRATFDNFVSRETLDEMELPEKLGVGQIPAVFVFNRQGKRVQTLTPNEKLTAGEMYEEVERLVVQLLAQL